MPCCYMNDKEIAIMLTLNSKSIRVLALVGSLVLVLPLSAILHETERLAINGSTVTHSSGSGQTQGMSGQPDKLPVRNCPLLELRAGLAFLSLKPASRFIIKAPIRIDAPSINQSVPLHSSIEIRNNPLPLEPHFSLLGILRI